MADYPAKCARCDVPLKGPPDPKSDDRLACPVCGESDSFENVMRETAEYVVQKMSEALGDGLGDIARKSGGAIKVTANHRPHRNYRFIVDYEP